MEQEGTKADQRIPVPCRDRKALLVTAVLPTSHPACLEPQEGGSRKLFPRRHLFVTKEVEDRQLCSVHQQL